MKRLMEGSEAMAEAAIAAGCRFFAGYPMTPFTELLEHFARRLPEVGGVCINAESELEAVGMAWGALATGARAATGSTGQGLSLMQESFSEITLAELPLVIFNMARGQQDYFQSTRGGGHGDYRHIVLAPCDLAEAVELTQLAFHLADTWRNPVLVYGDYLTAHIQEAVEVDPIDLGPVPEKDWALDGSLGGTGRSRIVSPLGFAKAGTPSPGIEEHLRRITAKNREMEATEARVEVGHVDEAETVIVAFGTPGKFVRYVVNQLRADGERIGFVRPITLWPYPTEAVATAAEGTRRVGVFELCAGQMIDDVRLSVLGRAPVVGIGGISTDGSGFGVGPLLDAEIIRDRILALHRGEELPRLPRQREAPGMKLVGQAKPELLLTQEHHMCPGCGEPMALRGYLEAIAELELTQRAIAVHGIGCYTSFSMTTDLDLVQALHGRAPSVATGVKRMLPDAIVFTLQGDGDMVNEGLQEVLHTAARGENVTCVLLNNGVFGETGGHMTATTVLGQRTKNSLDGRDAEYHGYPILIGDLIARLQGAAYVARGSVHNAAGFARTKRMFKRAFETQVRKEGFSFVEVLTMCPTGWFIPTTEGPSYMNDTLGEVHIMGELKVDGVIHTTEELHEENIRKAAEIEAALARGGIEN